MAKKKAEDIIKFNLRLPGGLYDRLGKMAEYNHRSINSEILTILERYVADHGGRPWSSDDLARALGAGKDNDIPPPVTPYPWQKNHEKDDDDI
jgi:hypothetical protein